MSSNSPAMGSPDWADFVFASPPVRDLKGHSRRTQHHRYFSHQLNSLIGVQGRNEACTALAIEYLVTLKLLARIKPQPFRADIDEIGAQIVPDFLVEGTANAPGLYVIETKSARFLTREKNYVLDGYRVMFSEHEIKYLVWTDNRPLNHSVRHHLINMRGAAIRDIPPDEVDALCSWVKTSSDTKMTNFYAKGFDLDCLFAAAWAGAVYIPITQPLSQDTRITPTPQEDYKAIFLNCTNSVDSWWQGLQPY